MDGNGRSEYDESERSSGSSTRSHVAIEKQLYCTHRCLLGLCRGLAVDPRCPNVPLHGQTHLARTEFLQQLSEQLTFHRGQDVGCCALYIHGARGTLLKVRLLTHGYTLVAKAVERTNLKDLQNEAQIYGHLGPLQGQHVPVCCSLLDLTSPFYL